jgi:hypothetical protein
MKKGVDRNRYPGAFHAFNLRDAFSRALRRLEGQSSEFQLPIRHDKSELPHPPEGRNFRPASTAIWNSMFCAGVTQMRKLQPGSCALAEGRLTLTTTLISRSAENFAELQRQRFSIQQQQEKLLNMRLADEIDGEVFSRKSVEPRDRAARLVLKIEGNNRQGNEYEDVAVKTFELSQSLRERWVTADCAIKRQILETLCLNCLSKIQTS